mgnify:CR=1 FL=1
MPFITVSDEVAKKSYAEYRAVFSELAAICKSEGVELVLIAGDVFDTYTPSAEAEEIFYSGVKELSNFSAVLVVSVRQQYRRKFFGFALFADCYPTRHLFFETLVGFSL